MMRFATAMFLAVVLLSPVRGQQPNPQALPKGVEAAKGVAYGPHERNTLDIYFIPKPDVPLTEPIKRVTVPLVIWVHGGAWSAGSKDGPNPAMPLLRRGFAVAAINYRLSQHARFPAQIEDCQAAVRFLRDNAAQYNLNPDRFGVMGASAGGHLAALMGTAGDEKAFADYGKVKKGSSKVQAVCDWFGPIDFLTLKAMAGAKHKYDFDSKDSPTAKLIGGPVQENKEKAAKANPLTYLSKDCPPFLILHGDKDATVPPGQSEMFHESLRKAGVDSTLIVVKGAGHDGKVGQGENAEAIARFFTKHLKGGK